LAIIKISGREYKVEVINGKRFIDGMPIDDFLKTIDPLTMIDLANTGFAAVHDEIKGTKPRKYQKMMDCFNLMRN
jgi:hypothetical protein